MGFVLHSRELSCEDGRGLRDRRQTESDCLVAERDGLLVGFGSTSRLEWIPIAIWRRVRRVGTWFDAAVSWKSFNGWPEPSSE